MSRWLVGSSMIRTLKGCNNTLLKPIGYVPPESTLTYFCTSSLMKQKGPKISRTLGLDFSSAASSMVDSTVLLPSKYSAWFWAKYPICTLCPKVIFPHRECLQQSFFSQSGFASCPFWPTKAIYCPFNTQIDSMKHLVGPITLEAFSATAITFPGVTEMGKRNSSPNDRLHLLQSGRYGPVF